MLVLVQLVFFPLLLHFILDAPYIHVFTHLPLAVCIVMCISLKTPVVGDEAV